jgi:uncharacterized membrane protein YhiD involved in acid resistance
MEFFTQFVSSPNLELLLKLGLACVVGGIIGLERYRNGHPAGMRTFAIITLTSTFLTASLGQAGRHRRFACGSGDSAGHRLHRCRGDRA